MIIEIRKAGFTNKGAELMLHSIVQKLREEFPDAILTMSPTPTNGSQPFNKITALGIRPKAWLWKWGIPFGDLARLIPKRLREMYGLVLDSEVDVVLDASGFGFSDQWGVASSKEFERFTKRWKRQETKVIMLPQALGPFNNAKIRRYVTKFMTRVDLAFAREKVSYDYILPLIGDKAKLFLAGDFTNLYHCELPNRISLPDRSACIIPNYRMFDKADSATSATYLPFLVKCVQRSIDEGYEPFVLIHEKVHDGLILEKISEVFPAIRVIEENCPSVIKAVIGESTVVIGSRFHGLVSALSQGVPSLGAGWSHKYQQLFESYGLSELHLTNISDEVEVDVALTKLFDVSHQSVWQHRIH